MRRVERRESAADGAGAVEVRTREAVIESKRGTSGQQHVTLRWSLEEPHAAFLLVAGIEWLFAVDLLRDGGGVGDVRVGISEDWVGIGLRSPSGEAVVYLLAEMVELYLEEVDAAVGRALPVLGSGDERWIAELWLRGRRGADVNERERGQDADAQLHWRWQGRDEKRVVVETTEEAMTPGAFIGSWVVVTLRWDPADPLWVKVVVGDLRRCDTAGWDVARKVLANGGLSGEVEVSDWEGGTRIAIRAAGRLGEVYLPLGFTEVFLARTTAVVPFGKEGSQFDVPEKKWAAALRALRQDDEQ